MKKVIITYIVCIVLAVLLWNFVIGMAIYKIPYVEQQSDIGKHYAPYSSITFGTEGFSYITMDKNGFNNDPAALDGTDRVLVIGDSHTEAMHVARENNFCSITQKLMALDNAVRIYNAGMSGNSIAEYIFYGNAYIKKFNPLKVVIQITNSDFTSDALDKSKNCYVSTQNNSFSIKKTDSSSASLKGLKDKFVSISPFTALLYNKTKTFLESLDNASNRPFLPKANPTVNIKAGQDYRALIDWEVSQIKQIYKEKAVFLYTPYTPDIDKNGTIRYVDDEEEEVKSIIIESCKKYNVGFIDMQSDFEKLLKAEKKFPRGFSNTQPDKGHLNRDGHYVTGMKLAEYLKGNVGF